MSQQVVTSLGLECMTPRLQCPGLCSSLCLGKCESHTLCSKSSGCSVPPTAHTRGLAISPIKWPPLQPPASPHLPPTRQSDLLHPGESCGGGAEHTSLLIWLQEARLPASPPLRGRGGASVNLGPGEQGLLGQSPKTSHFTRMEFHDLCILIKFLFLCNFS